VLRKAYAVEQATKAENVVSEGYAMTVLHALGRHPARRTQPEVGCPRICVQVDIAVQHRKGEATDTGVPGVIDENDSLARLSGTAA
jgi:hypothetical protein